jgi:serine/threonine protein kinase
VVITCYACLRICSLVKQKKLKMKELEPFKENLKNFLSWDFTFNLSSDGKADRILYRTKREIAELTNHYSSNDKMKNLVLNNLGAEWFSSHKIKQGKLLADGPNTSVFKVKYQGKTCAMKIEKIQEGKVNREWLLLNSCQHPNIIKGIDFVDSRVLLLEYAKKRDLESFLAKQPIDSSLRMKFAKEICEGMSFLHEQAILHLDLRCSNVLLTVDLQILLSDFGIANWKATDVDIPPEYRAIRYVCKEIYGKVKKSFTPDTVFDIRCFGIILFKLTLSSQDLQLLNEFNDQGRNLLKNFLKNKSEDKYHFICEVCLKAPPPDFYFIKMLFHLL